MKITGLKVLANKGWKQASAFTADDGRTINVAANNKLVLIDENQDIINATIATDTPLTYKVNDKIDIVLIGTATHTQFGWNIKAQIAI